MAQSKSTIINAVATSVGALLKWSTLATAISPTYFDVNGVDCSKLIFLVANLNSTDVGTTAGELYFGSSGGSACSGTSYHYPFSASKMGRMLVRTSPPTTDLKEAITCTAAAHIAITCYGPFEASRFKSSQGYIKVSKGKATSDAAKVKIAAILIP